MLEVLVKYMKPAAASRLRGSKGYPLMVSDTDYVVMQMPQL